MIDFYNFDYLMRITIHFISIINQAYHNKKKIIQP